MLHETPTRDPDGSTPIYVWSDASRQWKLILARDFVCPECGSGYFNDNWDDTYPTDYPIYICDCGEQFSQTDD